MQDPGRYARQKGYRGLVVIVYNEQKWKGVAIIVESRSLQPVPNAWDDSFAIVRCKQPVWQPEAEP